MKSLVFDTRLPAAAISEILAHAFPGTTPVKDLGHGDNGNHMFCVELSDPDTRERFRNALRSVEVQVGLRESIPPRLRQGIYDLVESGFEAPRHASYGREVLVPREPDSTPPPSQAQESVHKRPGNYSYHRRPPQDA